MVKYEELINLSGERARGEIWVLEASVTDDIGVAKLLQGLIRRLEF